MFRPPLFGACFVEPSWFLASKPKQVDGKIRTKSRYTKEIHILSECVPSHRPCFSLRCSSNVHPSDMELPFSLHVALEDQIIPVVIT